MTAGFLKTDSKLQNNPAENYVDNILLINARGMSAITDFE
jgi:hypothetical protein